MRSPNCPSFLYTGNPLPFKRWDAMLTGAGTAGAEIIKQKFEVVYNYMKDSWNIDLNQLRDIVQRRSSEIDKLDLENF